MGFLDPNAPPSRRGFGDFTRNRPLEAPGRRAGEIPSSVVAGVAGREPDERPTLRYLRADLPLRPGYVVTIEPGVYFIRALLEDPALRERHREAVDWERVDGMLDFGGIRIEDDVLVTADGAHSLSAATPKALDAIEEIRREALEA